jgi:hypothetical protein
MSLVIYQRVPPEPIVVELQLSSVLCIRRFRLCIVAECTDLGLHSILPSTKVEYISGFLLLLWIYRTSNLNHFYIFCLKLTKYYLFTFLQQSKCPATTKFVRIFILIKIVFIFVYCLQRVAWFYIETKSPARRCVLFSHVCSVQHVSVCYVLHYKKLIFREQERIPDDGV